MRDREQSFSIGQPVATGAAANPARRRMPDPSIGGMRGKEMAKSGDQYRQLLLHPNWQRKRLEILQRDRFACVDCSATDKTLNVHHLYYEKGRAPWEYEDQSLVTLCDDCHSIEHEMRAQYEAAFLRQTRVIGIRSNDLACNAEAIKWLSERHGPDQAREVVLTLGRILFWCSQADVIAELRAFEQALGAKIKA